MTILDALHMTAKKPYLQCFPRLDRCAPQEMKEVKEREKLEEMEEQFRDWVEIDRKDCFLY